MWKTLKAIYDYLLGVPDRLYPFTEKGPRGELISGERAYRYLKDTNESRYGDPYTLAAPKLLLWRQVFHVLGSIIIIIAADYLFRRVSFFNGFLFLGFSVFCLAVQEFYLHPQYYGQKMVKGLIDFATWMLPIFLYIIF